MTDTDRLEQEWGRFLLCEAKRDLVFLWNITAGSFGGPAYASEELPSVVARIATALLKSGCKVGFDDPDGDAWQTDARLLNAENLGTAIAARWLANPMDVEFLVFALRRSC
jgi:hypothetical protein